MLAMTLLSGCYTSHIHQPPTVLAPAPTATSVVILDVIDPDPERMPNAEDASFAAMRRELLPRFENSGVATRVLPPEDSGALPDGDRQFLVRFRPADYSNSVDANGGRLALLLSCGFLILPCPFIGLVPSAEQTIRTTWEARVYDVSGIEPSRVPLEGSREVAVMWDTTTLSPMLRRTYELDLSASLGAMSSAERDQLDRRIGRELATQLVAESAEDVAQAIRGAPATAGPPPQ
jgi:hypothetical protein